MAQPLPADDYRLFVLFLVFQFSFFLGRQEGLFLRLFLSFVFTSSVTHFNFSLFENQCFTVIRQTFYPAGGRHQAARAPGPFSFSTWVSGIEPARNELAVGENGGLTSGTSPNSYLAEFDASHPRSNSDTALELALDDFPRLLQGPSWR